MELGSHASQVSPGIPLLIKESRHFLLEICLHDYFFTLLASSVQVGFPSDFFFSLRLWTGPVAAPAEYLEYTEWEAELGKHEISKLRYPNGVFRTWDLWIFQSETLKMSVTPDFRLWGFGLQASLWNGSRRNWTVTTVRWILIYTVMQSENPSQPSKNLVFGLL